MIYSMILGFKHLLKHNMVKTQGKAPCRQSLQGRGKTSRYSSHTNSDSSEFTTILYEKLALLHLGKSRCFYL